jgi:hypothetical protein
MEVTLNVKRRLGCLRTGGWRKCQNKDLRNWNISRNVVRAIKINMKWEWHVACMEELKNAYEF